MKSSTAKICLGFVLLAIGCGIYLLFRSKTLYIYVWCKSLGLSGYIDILRLAVLHWPLPSFVKYSLPDGLYCAAYLCIMDAIWHEDNTWKKYLVISVVPIISIGSELLQYFGIVRGTFDMADLACYLISPLLFLMIDYKKILFCFDNYKSKEL